MRTTAKSLSLALFALMLGAVAFVDTSHAASTAGALDPALRNQVKSSIDVGLKHLRFKQRDDGSWADSVQATSLVLRALAESHRRYTSADGPFMRRGHQYVASALASYAVGTEDFPIGSVAAALLALQHSTEAAHHDLRARAKVRMRSRLPSIEAGSEEAGSCADLGLVVEALRASAVPADPMDRHHLEGLVRGCDVDAALPDLIAANLAPETAREAQLAAAIQRTLPAAEETSTPYTLDYFLADALARDGQALVIDEDGASRSWRTELARRLTARQEFVGTWPVESGDLEERTVTVATCFALLALERVYEDPDAQ